MNQNYIMDIMKITWKKRKINDIEEENNDLLSAYYVYLYVNDQINHIDLTV